MSELKFVSETSTSLNEKVTYKASTNNHHQSAQTKTEKASSSEKVPTNSPVNQSPKASKSPVVSIQPLQSTNKPVTKGTNKASSTAPGQKTSTSLPGTAQTAAGSRASPAIATTGSRASPTIVTTAEPTTIKPFGDYQLSGVVLCERKLNAWLEVDAQVSALGIDESVYT